MTLEQKIERLMIEKNISYGEAKEILEDNEVDLEKALSFLENKENDKENEDLFSKLLLKLKGVLDKGNKTKLVVLKRTRTVVRLPLTYVILSVFIGFNLVVVSTIIVFITGCKIYIQRA